MSLGKRSKAQVEKLRSLLLERDSYECVVSGSRWAWIIPCGGHLDVQHRARKGMGGSAANDLGSMLVIMCRNHNRADVDRADFHAACLRNGWSVESWVPSRIDMSRVPIRYADGWHLLSGLVTSKAGLKALYRFPIGESSAIEIISEIYDYEGEAL